jgi:pyruvate dehydrogenase E2 component (dihydrolipoamide acetyltransferase)
MSEIRMPQLGHTMAEGTILKWLKREGETVAKGEPLLEVETDKVAMVVESPAEGVLAEILRGENETVPVGEPIARMEGAEKRPA